MPRALTSITTVVGAQFVKGRVLERRALKIEAHHTGDPGNPGLTAAVDLPSPARFNSDNLARPQFFSHKRLGGSYLI